MKHKDLWFFITVLVLANLATIADKDFFDWKMNLALLLMALWIYANRRTDSKPE
jgi:predicted membrane protein